MEGVHLVLAADRGCQLRFAGESRLDIDQPSMDRSVDLDQCSPPRRKAKQPPIRGLLDHGESRPRLGAPEASADAGVDSGISARMADAGRLCRHGALGSDGAGRLGLRRHCWGAPDYGPLHNCAGVDRLRGPTEFSQSRFERFSTPTRRFRSGCCACAASDQSAAEPLIRLTNSRRCMCPP